MKLRALLLAATLAAAPLAPSRADFPVIDMSNLEAAFQQLQEWAQQLQFMEQQLNQAIQMVHSLTNIPNDLIGQATGLMNISIQNPLQNIAGNLQTLMFGSGTGTCSGASSFLSSTQYFHANGTDIMGSWLNGGASRMSGLMACTDTMMRSTQDRITQLPALLDQLQSCQDVSCTTAMSARINAEVANIQAQQQQTTLIGQQAGYYQQVQDMQIMQRQRQNAEEFGGATRWSFSADPVVSSDNAPMFAGGQ